MRRGFKCKRELLEKLKEKYDDIVSKKYNGDYLLALKKFDFLAEDYLRGILSIYYKVERSRDQAWKTCKGSLYEYAVFMNLLDIIYKRKLENKIEAIMGDKAFDLYKDQLVIRNWSDILPDADIVIIDRRKKIVKAILSCKTSLRERLTETAFWKRELEKTRDRHDIKLIFVTTDKDNELRIDTNRYILLHVIDSTFVTNPDKYNQLMEAYKKKYGERKDFEKLMSRVKPIDEMEEFICSLI